MKFHFSIEYHTVWGQQIGVIISRYLNGGKCVTENFLLDTQDGLFWKGEVFYNNHDTQTFSYQYVLYENGVLMRHEWNLVPRMFNAAPNHVFIFSDSWRDVPLCNHMYSSAYTHCISDVSPNPPYFAYYDRTFVFRVQAPQLQAGQVLALMGSIPQLGAWDPRFSLRMTRAGINEWVLAISAEGIVTPFQYKYVILDEETSGLIAWEEGENRSTPSFSVEQVWLYLSFLCVVNIVRALAILAIFAVWLIG